MRWGRPEGGGGGGRWKLGVGRWPRRKLALGVVLLAFRGRAVPRRHRPRPPSRTAALLRPSWPSLLGFVLHRVSFFSRTHAFLFRSTCYCPCLLMTHLPCLAVALLIPVVPRHLSHLRSSLSLWTSCPSVSSESQFQRTLGNTIARLCPWSDDPSRSRYSVRTVSHAVALRRRRVSGRTLPRLQPRPPTPISLSAFLDAPLDAIERSLLDSPPSSLFR